MKNFLIPLLIIFFNLPAPLSAAYTYNEERGEFIEAERYHKKLLRVLSDLGKEAKGWASDHKKGFALSTITFFALTTMYYTLGADDESSLGTSPIDPCTFNSDGIFDLHACAHYLESQVDTSTLNLFLASTQEKFIGLWENVSDPEKLQKALTQIWSMLQNDRCHVHDEF